MNPLSPRTPCWLLPAGRFGVRGLVVAGILQSRETTEFERWLSVLEQCRVCRLVRPMREWQSFPHRVHRNSDAAVFDMVRVFLIWRLASACCLSEASRLLSPSLTVDLQDAGWEAVSSQVLRSMFSALRSLLQTSLNRRWDLPVARDP